MIDMTEDLVKSINVASLNQRLKDLKLKADENEKKYYYMENKVKLLS